MQNKRYHFIAIGGVGMSGLAKYLLEKGFEVSGSDVVESKYTEKVKKLGAKVYIGHSADNVPENSIVIASSAIKENNPEIIRAKELNLQIYHRSDLLKEIAHSENYFIGYSGTHGKTTTSGLSSYVLSKANYSPSFVVGGIIPGLDTNAEYDKPDYFVAELDESDGTIVKYVPDCLVINNLEADHLDFYKNGITSLIETFNKVTSNLKPTTKVLINSDCEILKEINAKNIITYAIDTKADYMAKNINKTEDFTSFDVYKNNEFCISLKIQLHGTHNVYNTLAVFASLVESGIDKEKIAPHFSTFTGMGRRFQFVGEFDGVKIYDDYAHHPTEIKATLSSLDCFKNKNIIAVFQPHRYSRLKSLWNDFLTAFDNVDKVVVTDIYAASELPLTDVDSKHFTDELLTRVPAVYIKGDMEQVAEKIYPTLKENDVLITLGAGTVTNVGKNLMKIKKGNI